MGAFLVGTFDSFFSMNLNTFIYNRTGTFNMICWHSVELTALILYPAMQLKLLTMCCWLHAHSLTGHFVHWRRVWPRRGSSVAAACNMWPLRLPGSPLSIFHYSLFNLSPCCSTAVQSLTMFSSCQENLCPFVFPRGRFHLFNDRKLNSLWTENVAVKAHSWKFRFGLSPGQICGCMSNNHLWHQIPTDKGQ